MELPHIGKHCGLAGCNELDFLPYTCNRCRGVFCQEHWKVDDHACPKLHDPSYDRIVPSCPLCGQVVPVGRNEDPNRRVDAHIASGCQVTATAASRAPPTSKCALKGCTAKTTVPVVCKACHLKFCLKHRLERDHDCTPPPPPPPPSAGARFGAKMAAAASSAAASVQSVSGGGSGAGRRPGAGPKKGGKKGDCAIM
ncbi:hypothetical protein H9P43_002277 [Blastocladiella emersonii ATCC 22665]|nr:hypothetical protein H9P43_002277 [Blastocladiella emersonii ATCC 22665]